MRWSAIQRPYSGYYRSIYRKAAALVESVARNHGFVDGNKRTYLLLLTLLLDRSGYKLTREGQAAVEGMLVAVASGRMRFNVIEAWMKRHVRRR